MASGDTWWSSLELWPVAPGFEMMNIALGGHSNLVSRLRISMGLTFSGFSRTFTQHVTLVSIPKTLSVGAGDISTIVDKAKNLWKRRMQSESVAESVNLNTCSLCQFNQNLSEWSCHQHPPTGNAACEDWCRGVHGVQRGQQGRADQRGKGDGMVERLTIMYHNS